MIDIDTEEVEVDVAEEGRGNEVSTAELEVLRVLGPVNVAPSGQEIRVNQGTSGQELYIEAVPSNLSPH